MSQVKISSDKERKRYEVIVEVEHLEKSISSLEKSISEIKERYKTKIEENPYQKLRTQAINVTAEQLQLKLNDDAVYGIVMDWNMGNAIVTVFSFTTGDASVYISTGQAYIGGYAHETVIRAAKEFVKVGDKYFSKATKTDKIEPTNESKVDFYFLTKSGKYYIEDNLSLIEKGESELTELFEAGNKVITEYRLITDEQ